jgi:hypothetical protein
MDEPAVCYQKRTQSDGKKRTKNGCREPKAQELILGQLQMGQYPGFKQLSWKNGWSLRSTLHGQLLVSKHDQARSI